MTVDEFDLEIRKIKRRLKTIREDLSLADFERDDEAEKFNERLVALETSTDWMTKEVRELRTAQRSLSMRIDKLVPKKE